MSVEFKNPKQYFSFISSGLGRHTKAFLCIVEICFYDSQETRLNSFFSSFGRDPHPRRKQQQDSNVVESSTVSKSDAGSDGTQPASCVDIQNRQSTYSCRCPMYGACQNDVCCGLFCSATLAIQCRSKAPFVHERLETPNTSPKAVEPDP